MNNSCLYYVTEDSHTNHRPLNLEKECGLEYLGSERYRPPSHLREVQYYKLPDNTYQLLKFHTCAIFVDNKTGKATTLEVEPHRLCVGRMPAEEDFNDRG